MFLLVQLTERVVMRYRSKYR